MKFLKLSLLVLWVVFSAFLSKAQNYKNDIFDKYLEKMNLEISDLGYQPKTYWTSFPQEVPYKFHAFDDLFAQPLAMYDFTKVISSSVRLFLDSNYVQNNNTFLYRAVYYSAISKHIGGFRGYIPNPTKYIYTNKSIKSSLNTLLEITNAHGVSSKENNNFQIVSADLSSSLNNLPSPIESAIADLVYCISEAFKWRQIAIRNIDTLQMEKIYHIRDFAFSQTNGAIYYPEFEDCYKNLDRESMFYSSLILLAGIDVFRYDVDSLLKNNTYDLGEIDIKINTLIGKIMIKGTADDIYKSKADENILLIVDLGGNDIYNGSFAATNNLNNPISLLVDFSGDDLYKNTNSAALSQGVGMFGTGILMDMEGDDQYQSVNYSQGLGVFGLGLLCDICGDDDYIMQNSGQACGYFGIGLNFDISGNDNYYIFGDGQGMGGVGGIGILANHSGDDYYVAEAEPSKSSGRADYHSKGKVNANYAQGVGAGRRGDFTDGHNWAGGIGALIDIHGEDHYKAGNFSQAVGYWFGMGILFDGNGNDLYESVYFTQASGAHFAMGVLIDEKGNDKHILKKTAGAGLSFGWDFVNTLFIDNEGDDIYEAKMISIASAMLRSNSFFFDLKGDDIYRCYSQEGFFGATDERPFYSKLSPSQTYFYEVKQFSLFFDLSGADQYLIWEGEKKSWEKHPFVKNNKKWYQPNKKQALKSNSFGFGVDAKSGYFNKFDHWKPKQ